MSKPASILDPAAGKCELINANQSTDKWAVDLNAYFIGKYAGPKVKIVVGDIFKVALPENYFVGIFISNFLEHLESQERVTDLLESFRAGTR